MKLLLATNNSGKIREFQELLSDTDFEVTTPHQEGLALDVEETEPTLEGNARLKAEAFAAASGLLSLADDSGLEVEALNGEPGVATARYAGPKATDAQRLAFLLSKMDGVPEPQRSAKFRCVIAIAGSGREVLYAKGEVQGIITPDVGGGGGFGFDPVFFVPESGKRLSEMSLQEKNVVSHRGKAIQAARSILDGIAAGHDDS